MKHLAHWSWVHCLYRYSDKHLLIADRFFIDRVHKARPTALNCKTATPDNYQKAITPDIAKVLVFSTENELALVRRIQEEFPGVKVTSGTYGYACNNQARQPKLVEYKQPAIRDDMAAPVVMIATPQADAEFIAKAMQNNGLPYCHEYLGRGNATWLEHHRHFQVTRFFACAINRYVKDGPPSFLLQTDVLEQIFKHTPFGLKHLVQYLKSSGARVVLVRRNDMALPAVFGQIMDRTAERSIWTKKEQKKLILKLLPQDYEGCFERIAHIRDGEAMLADIAGALPEKAMTITLEDFVRDQSGHLSKIGKLLEADVTEPHVHTSYAKGFENAKDLLDETLEFKRLMIDKLGLHVI